MSGSDGSALTAAAAELVVRPPEACRRVGRMSELRCLRCKTVPLTEAGPSDPQIAFFECPSCGRHYALKPGKQLTFRWLHPISLALYPVQFDESPAERAAEVAASLAQDRSEELLALFAREMRLELEEPTQQVRDMLDCRASEEEVRNFLRSVAEEIEALLAYRRPARTNTAERGAAPDRGGIRWLHGGSPPGRRGR
jgi:hypothetical protein